MKQTLHVALALLILACPVLSNAQGWKWAVQSTFSNNSIPGIESSLIATDKSGNVYTSGSVFYNTGTLGLSMAGITTTIGGIALVDSTNCSQMFVTKTNAAGTVLWAKGSQHSDVSSAGITTDASGNLYVLGAYDSLTCRLGSILLSNSSGGAMYFIAKYDPNGNILMAQNVVPCPDVSANDLINAYGGIGVDGSGNIYIAGIFNTSSVTIGTTTLNNTATYDCDLFIAKYDLHGNPLWAKMCGKVGPGFTSVQVTPKGDLYVGGIYMYSSLTCGATTLTNASGAGNYILKFYATGTLAWAHSSDCGTDDNSGVVAMDDSNHIFQAGSFSTATTSLGGQVLTNTSSGTHDVFIAKYDTLGNVIWAKSGGGPANDRGYSVAVDGCGKVWFCGGMNQNGFTSGYSMTFSGHTIAGPAFSNDDPMFLVEYDASGNYLNGMMLPSGGDDNVAMVIDNLGNFYVCSDWAYDSYTFGSNTVTSTTNGEYYLLTRYTYDFVTCTTSEVPSIAGPTNEITLFPNPASGECTIHSAEVFCPGSKAEISDITGRLIHSYSLSGNDTVIPLSGYRPGIYECRILSQNGNQVTKKLVIAE